MRRTLREELDRFKVAYHTGLESRIEPISREAVDEGIRLLRRAAEADAKLAEAEKRIGELEAIVSKLPRTADGVPIVPEMTLYRTHMGDQQEKLTVRRFNLIHGLNGAEWWVFTYEHMAGFPARELSAALASRPGKGE
jgi:hypothetical protein